MLSFGSSCASLQKNPKDGRNKTIYCIGPGTDLEKRSVVQDGALCSVLNSRCECSQHNEPLNSYKFAAAPKRRLRSFKQHVAIGSHLIEQRRSSLAFLSATVSVNEGDKKDLPAKGCIYARHFKCVSFATAHLSKQPPERVRGRLALVGPSRPQT